MPAKTLFDYSGIDLNHILFDQEAIRKHNLQRGAMEHLNAIVWADPEKMQIIGYKDVRADEFWTEGHIPGRPLLPGVIMIEAAAQLASFYTRQYSGWKGFIGFAGVENARFRQQVAPGVRLYLVGKILWNRHHRMACEVHGLVNGNIAFEVTIIGMEM